LRFSTPDIFSLALTKLTRKEKIKQLIYCVIMDSDIGAEYGDVRPLDKNRQRMLDFNRPQLAELIQSDEMFVGELYSARCITRSQREHLVSIKQPRERNTQLLGFLTRRSIADFDTFIKCLIGGNMAHLVNMLSSSTDKGETFLTNHNCDCNTSTNTRGTMHPASVLCALICHEFRLEMCGNDFYCSHSLPFLFPFPPIPMTFPFPLLPIPVPFPSMCCLK